MFIVCIRNFGRGLVFVSSFIFQASCDRCDEFAIVLSCSRKKWYSDQLSIFKFDVHPVLGKMSYKRMTDSPNWLIEWSKILSQLRNVLTQI